MRVRCAGDVFGARAELDRERRLGDEIRCARSEDVDAEERPQRRPLDAVTVLEAVQREEIIGAAVGDVGAVLAEDEIALDLVPLRIDVEADAGAVIGRDTVARDPAAVAVTQVDRGAAIAGIVPTLRMATAPMTTRLAA